ncbi:MAG TPA: zf-HC2 domain-containing protein [Gemmatimonadaceae bacterium]|jgi:hypothetical protein|nr:zf-HC2 domain-containing protein [Gemmatimonadaceae bacterium]
MQHPEEGIIHAWLDGELPAEEAAALEAHAATCADCSAKVAEARGLIAASSRIVSALDIVPGGVIPAARQARRPWYASTQLRAAAAVLIVAGASALVMRNGGKRAMEDAVTVSAPLSTEQAPAAPPAATLPSLAAAPTEAASDEGRDVGKSSTSSSRQALKLEDSQSARKMDRADDARAEKAFAPPPPPRENANALTGSVGGVAAQIAPAPVSAPAPMIAMRRAAEPEFKKVRSDSTGTVARTIFRTSDSVDVTLTDIAPLPQVKARSVQQSKVLDAPASIVVTGTAEVTAKPKAEPQSEIFTITWTDKRGHTMTLRGPVPLTVLEQVRRTLPEDQR